MNCTDQLKVHTDVPHLDQPDTIIVVMNSDAEKQGEKTLSQWWTTRTIDDNSGALHIVSSKAKGSIWLLF